MTLLVGEAGIGKTRTARQFAATAMARGVRVLRGTCNEGEQTPAYGPWAAGLGGLLRSLPASARPSVVGPGAEKAYALVPELRRRGAAAMRGSQQPVSDARPWLFERLAELLVALCRPLGLLVVLDNLQWADPDSLRFLEYTVRECSTNPLMILCTARESELSLEHPVTRVLGEVAKLPSYHRVHLGGLGRAEVAQYLKRSLGSRSDSRMVEEFHRRSGGNPLFLIQLARDVRTLRTTATGEMPVPSEVRDVIARRLALLPEECRSLLSIASVCGRSFEERALRWIIGPRSGGRVSDLLRRASVQGFVAESSEPDASWQFTHALVQETLYEALSVNRRAELHGQVADAIEAVHGSAGGLPVDMLYRHRLRAAAARGAEGIARVATMCVQRARERCAPELAVRVLSRESRWCGRLHRRPNAGGRQQPSCISWGRRWTTWGTHGAATF